nr:MAG TPA: hypothetical protein [Caudoviricetes sp.]
MLFIGIENSLKESSQKICVKIRQVFKQLLILLR